MLWKCHTQYASKLEKFISAHRTGKGQFSFQPQRIAMSKNVQTTAQLHSFHMLARSCSKSSKLGFNQELDIQIYKMDLEKAEEPEIKLPTSVGSWKKQENSRKTSTSASLSTLRSLIMWITTNWIILKEMGIPHHFTCLLRNLYTGQEARVRIGNGTTDWLQIGKGVHQGCILSPRLFNLYAKYIMQNARLGWSTSWNQNCWVKYQ